MIAGTPFGPTNLVVLYGTVDLIQRATSNMQLGMDFVSMTMSIDMSPGHR